MMKKIEKLIKEYEIKQTNLHKQMGELKELDPLNTYYLKKQEETIKTFEEYKKLFLEAKWKPYLKRIKTLTLVTHLFSIFIGLGLGTIITVGILIIIILFAPSINIIPVIISIITLNCIITKKINNHVLPLNNKMIEYGKEIRKLELEKEFNTLEQIISYALQKRKTVNIDDSITIEAHTISEELIKQNDVKDFCEKQNTVFEIHSKPKEYTKTKRF